MRRFLSIVWWLSVCSVCSVGTLRSQPANVQADPTTGALFRPSAATFISGNGLLTTAAAGSTYSPLAGSTSFTTAGTITTGTWNASTIALTRGGTGATTAASARTAFGIPQPGLGQSSLSAFVYDTFDAVDGLLSGRVTPTGQTWGCGGAGGATAAILNGAIYTTANTYNSLFYGANVRRVAGVFFYSSSGSGGPAAIIACSGTELANMIHFDFSRTGGTLTKRQAGGAFVNMNPVDSSGGGIGWNLRADGTRYSIALEIDYTANTVTVIGPNGIRYTSPADSAVSTIAPDTGIWQNSNWSAVEMGHSSKAAEIALLGGVSPAADVVSLRGNGVAARHVPIFMTATTVGWYRVLSAASFNGFTIQGTLRFAGSDTIFSSSGEIYVAAGTGGGTIYQKFFAGTGNTGSLTQARVTWDGASQVALDIYIGQATGGGYYYFTWDGYGTPIASPVVGAVTLGSANTYTLDYTTSAVGAGTTSNIGAINIGAGGFSATGAIAQRSTPTASNRITYYNQIGLGNYTGQHIWGVNGATSDTDAVERMRLDTTGLHIGTAGGAAAPVHIQNATSTSSMQAGLLLQSASGAGQTMPMVGWNNGLGIAAALDALREGGGFLSSLRFWTMNSGGTITQVGSFNGAGDFIPLNNVTLSGGAVNLTSTSAGYVAGTEQSSSPAAPAANGFRLYAKDNGAGKTVLYVRFASGAEQQIAIEP